MTLPDHIPAPGERFNFAQHLLQLNAARAGKAAFIDDLGALSYGELAERVRRMAAGAARAGPAARGARAAADAGLQRLAGEPSSARCTPALVPVAVNTLLTADDYAYMLEHSRAQAVLVSGALLPALSAAMTKSRPRGGARSSSRSPVAPLHAGRGRVRGLRRGPAAAGQAGRHRPRRPGLLALFVGLHRPAQGHGAFARQPLLDGRALRQGACSA